MVQWNNLDGKRQAEITFAPPSDTTTSLPFLSENIEGTANVTVDRVYQIMVCMRSRGLNPCYSDRICSSMVRFCGMSDLNQAANAWMSLFPDSLQIATNFVTALSVRWSRLNHAIQSAKWPEYPVELAMEECELRERLSCLEEQIDRTVRQILRTMAVDRALLGLLTSHYVKRRRIDIAERILVAMFGPESSILPQFIRENHVFSPNNQHSEHTGALSCERQFHDDAVGKSMTFVTPILSSISYSDYELIPNRIMLRGKVDSISMYAPLFVRYYVQNDELRLAQLLKMIEEIGLEMDDFFLNKVVSGCFAHTVGDSMHILIDGDFRQTGKAQ